MVSEDKEEASISDTTSTTASARSAVHSNGKVQALTLVIAIVSLLVSTWSLIETKRSDEKVHAVYTALSDSLTVGQVAGKHEGDQANRELFEDSVSLGCPSSCGYTTCTDAPFETTGTLSAKSGCLPYRTYYSYVINTLIPRIKEEHMDFGLDAWNDEGIPGAQCNSMNLDYELYNIDGTYSCIRSASFTLVTQLSCFGYTGLGSCGVSGNGGGGGGGGVGGEDPMCIPFCMCEGFYGVTDCYDRYLLISPGDCWCN